MKVDVAVAEWAERFPREAASTTANNASQAKHFAEHFPDRELDSVTREEFERFAQVYPGAARYARTLLNDYREASVIEENVSEGVRIPRKAKRNVVVPTPEEVAKLCSAAWDLAHLYGAKDARRMTQVALMIQVAAWTGLREGELRALAVADVQESTENDVFLAEVVWSIDRGERLKKPKTKSSADTFTFLGEAGKRVAGVRGGRYMKLFSGRPITASTKTAVRDGRFFDITRAERQVGWEKVRAAAGIGVTWHSLRHFCATWLLDHDASIDDVALQLRCSVEEVRRTYGHPDRKAAFARLRGIEP